MTHFYRPPRRSNPSRKQIRNELKVLHAFNTGEPVGELEAPIQRKPSNKPRETEVYAPVKEWARSKGGQLYRNPRGLMPLANGRMMKFGVGPDGAGDLIGPIPVRITQSMVGRTIAVYAEIELKREGGGVIAEHQQRRIDYLRDMGAIAGVARNPVDCEVMLATWSTRKL